MYTPFAESPCVIGIFVIIHRFQRRRLHAGKKIAGRNTVELIHWSSPRVFRGITPFFREHGFIVCAGTLLIDGTVSTALNTWSGGTAVNLPSPPFSGKLSIRPASSIMFFFAVVGIVGNVDINYSQYWCYGHLVMVNSSLSFLFAHETLRQSSGKGGLHR